MHMTGAWILLIFVVLRHGSDAPACCISRGWVNLSTQRFPTVRDAVYSSPPSAFSSPFSESAFSLPPSPTTLDPSAGLHVGGRHIHHLVWGILILLAVGYAWLAEAGSGSSPSSIFVSRLLAVLYGVGAALTLDEFALWLNLADVYWSPQGRESIDAVILFGAALAAGAWGAPLFSALKRKATI